MEAADKCQCTTPRGQYHYTHTHAHTHARTCVRRGHARTHTHSDIHTHTRTHAHTCARRGHARTHTQLHTCARRGHTHTHTHARTHAHMPAPRELTHRLTTNYTNHKSLSSITFLFPRLEHSLFQDYLPSSLSRSLQGLWLRPWKVFGRKRFFYLSEFRLPYHMIYITYDSMRLFYWHLHYVYDLILYLCSRIILCVGSISPIHWKMWAAN